MKESRDFRTNSSSPIDSASDQIESETMRYRKIAKIMTSKVLTISPENTLHEAAQLMGEKHIGSLIVIKYDTPVGIITEGDLLNVVSKGIPLEIDWIRSSPSIRNQKVEKAMSFPLVKICVNYTLKDAARTMIEKRIRRLGVCDSGNLCGIITTSDMIGHLPQVPETMKSWFEVDHFMSKQVVSADERTLLENVAKIMAEKHVGSVIVTSQEEPIGIFTERDLLTKFLAQDRSLIEEVGNVCSSPLITAPVGISAHNAASIMVEKHVKRLPITKDGKLVGVLSARDLVEAYARG
ncbi:MAG: CBS domain-containing protein [Candidatus Bathyarchaeia archaeon]|nr:CBS domain-containing protein [Candidatus Bathyarchaeia archaeon]